MHPYLSLEHPIRFAHRGSRVLWPENTMVAFQGAVDLGYRYIETDVRMTADRIVVVFHDKTLERTTNGVGRVDQHTFEELSRLDAGWTHDPDHEHPFRGRGVGISRLDEVLLTWPDVHFNIDLKATGLEWPVAEVVKNTRRTNSVLIGSFFDNRVAKFRRVTHGTVATSAGPAAAVSLLAASRVGRRPRRAPTAYQLPFDAKRAPIDRKLINAAHSAGAHVHVWTVNTSQDMHRMLDVGVDGIVTDRPDILNDVIAERRRDG